MRGFSLVYADDLLFLLPLRLAEDLHRTIADVWDCTVLQPARPASTRAEAFRFLGVEIETCPGVFLLSQQAYIGELLRAHKLPENRKAKIPAPKEWLNVEVTAPGVEVSLPEADIREAQRYVGELLWLSQRTRPDLQFAVSIMGSLTLHKPKRVSSIAEGTLVYLQGTKTCKLRCVPMQGEVAELCASSDASFAPTGTRNHGCSAVFYRNVPISWKSSRQPFVTSLRQRASWLRLQKQLSFASGKRACVGWLRLMVDNQAADAESPWESPPGVCSTTEAVVHKPPIQVDYSLGLYAT